MTVIAIVDCGMGNLHSVAAATRRARPDAAIHTTADPAILAAADRVIFPGDGNFGACMRQIHALGLAAALRAAAATKPFFGICVGMQVLYAGSEESPEPGLALFPTPVRRLPPSPTAKLPHIGWNTATLVGAHPVTRGMAATEWFYFVHSYYAARDDHTVMTCEHGTAFSAMTARDNLVATQFHPEKSGARGNLLLQNFLTQ